MFFHSFTMQGSKGSVENRGRSPRFSTLPTCIYGTLFTLLNNSERSVENNGFCQNQYQYWVFFYVPLHTFKEHPLWMMNIFGVLYSKRIYSASEIWLSFSSCHEKCAKTSKIAFKRDRLK